MHSPAGLHHRRLLTQGGQAASRERQQSTSAGLMLAAGQRLGAPPA
jgi:hypothetical protein